MKSIYRPYGAEVSFSDRIPGARAPGYSLPSLRDWRVIWKARCRHGF